MGLTLGLSNTRLASRSYRSGFFPCDEAGALQARASNRPQTHSHTPNAVRRPMLGEVFTVLAPWCSSTHRRRWAHVRFAVRLWPRVRAAATCLIDPCVSTPYAVSAR